MASNEDARAAREAKLDELHRDLHERAHPVVPRADLSHHISAPLIHQGCSPPSVGTRYRRTPSSGHARTSRHAETS